MLRLPQRLKLFVQVVLPVFHYLRMLQEQHLHGLLLLPAVLPVLRLDRVIQLRKRLLMPELLLERLLILSLLLLIHALVRLLLLLLLLILFLMLRLPQRLKLFVQVVLPVFHYLRMLQEQHLHGLLLLPAVLPVLRLDRVIQLRKRLLMPELLLERLLILSLLLLTLALARLLLLS